MSHKSLAILSALAAIVALFAFAISHQQQLEKERLAEITSDWAQKNYQELKRNGRTDTSINSPEHMLLVANDAECAQRLTYVHFDMTDLNASEFSLVQKFSNLKKLSFYDCDGINTLLGYVANMPSVNEVHFDYMRPSDELLKRLGAFPNLKRLLFNYIDSGDLEAIKRALPNVQVEIYDESRAAIQP